MEKQVWMRCRHKNEIDLITYFSVQLFSGVQLSSFGRRREEEEGTREREVERERGKGRRVERKNWRKKEELESSGKEW